MNNSLTRLIAVLILLTISAPSFSQEDPQRIDKLYSMSGFGVSIPVGESSSFMRPKFSTTVGFNLGLGKGDKSGNGGLFLYPKLSLHVYGYDNTELDPRSNAELTNGRATTYLLNVALGYRKVINRFAFYAFIGGGGGFILTPRVVISPQDSYATLNNKTNHLGIIEPGAGAEYRIGGVNLFLESSYMQGLGKIGDHTFHSVPVTIGIKPNLSKLLYKKKNTRNSGSD